MPTLYKELEEQERQRQRQQQPANPWHDVLVPVCPHSSAGMPALPLRSRADLMWPSFLDDHGEWHEKAVGLTASPSILPPLPQYSLLSRHRGTLFVIYAYACVCLILSACAWSFRHDRLCVPSVCNIVQTHVPTQSVCPIV